MAEIHERIDEMVSTCAETRVALATQLGEIKSEIAALKVKAGVWGLLGGLIPVLVGMSALLVKGCA